MNFFEGTISEYSVTDFDSPLQIVLSPNGRFFAVLTNTTLSLWTAGVHQTLVGITIRNKEFLESTGLNKQLVWDCDGTWLGVLVCDYCFSKSQPIISHSTYNNSFFS